MRTTVKRRVPRHTRTAKRLLVVGKMTAYMQAVATDKEQLRALIDSGNPAVSSMMPEHQAHMESIARVREILKQHDATFVRVDALKDVDIDAGKFDRILVVGGDGTVLEASHHTRRTPILGIKSAPRSHGHFCLADRDTLPAVLDEIESGRRKPLSLMRINAFIDGCRVGPDVLNEVLLESTTSTTSYILQAGQKTEEQMSDGIFFGTAAGCTAWMRAYGSEIVPVTDRSIQYLVRGAFISPTHGLGLLHGFSCDGTELSVVSKSADAKVAVDGRRNSFLIPRGSKLVIKPSPHDVRIYADADCNDRYLASQAARFACRQASRH